MLDHREGTLRLEFPLPYQSSQKEKDIYYSKKIEDSL